MIGQAVADAESDLETLASQRFGALSEAEIKLLRAAREGRTAHCGSERTGPDEPANDPANAHTWEQMRVIRAELILWLCIDGTANKQVHPSGLQTMAARMEGLFNLSFVKVPFPLKFTNCSFPFGMRLRGAALPELILTKCWIDKMPSQPDAGFSQDFAILAQGVQIKGLVCFNKGFHAEGGVNLYSSQIGGNLVCEGGNFKNATGAALNAENSKIDGAVLLRNNFESEGEVRLFSATIGGALECDKGKFKSSTGPALNVEGAKIGGAVLLRNNFESEGEVRLRSATIGGDLECDKGSFKNSTGPALNVEGAKNGGAVLLRNNFESEGEVRLFSATIGGALECDKGKFKSSTGPAINAYRCKIGGAVLLRDNFLANGAILLNSATIGGNLDCSRGTFENPSNPALNVGGAIISGAALLSDDFKAEGEVRLVFATIGGSLECEGTFKNCTGPAINAYGCKISYEVLFRNNFQATGEVQLSSATIGGSLECDKGSFTNANGIALNAQGCKITSSLILRDLRAEGEVCFDDAAIGGNLIIKSNLGLSPANSSKVVGAKLNLRRADIKGALNLIDMKTGTDTMVDLSEASCNVLHDNVDASWPSEGKLVLDGFVYRRIANPRLPSLRLKWLRAQLPLAKQERRGLFRPQPYRQLVSVLRPRG